MVLVVLAQFLKKNLTLNKRIQKGKKTTPQKHQHNRCYFLISTTIELVLKRVVDLRNAYYGVNEAEKKLNM